MESFVAWCHLFLEKESWMVDALGAENHQRHQAEPPLNGRFEIRKSETVTLVPRPGSDINTTTRNRRARYVHPHSLRSNQGTVHTCCGALESKVEEEVGSFGAFRLIVLLMHLSSRGPACMKISARSKSEDGQFHGRTRNGFCTKLSVSST